MAIYFSSLFCRKEAILKCHKNLQIQFDNGKFGVIAVGDRCIVEDIIGYGYNIREEKTGHIIRIMNSSMAEYFEIIENTEVLNDSEGFGFDKDELDIVTLQKDFEIKDVVKISKGKKFFHLIDNNQGKVFHELFSIDSKKKKLRMKDSEFVYYFIESEKL